MLRQAQHENFALQLAQYRAHASVLDNFTFIDDRDVPAQRLRFLEVMRCQNDGRPCFVYLPQVIPHGTTNFDVDAGRRFVEYQQSGLVNECPRDHKAPLHAAGEAAGNIITPVPQAQRAQVLLRAFLGKPTFESVIARLRPDDAADLFPQVEIDLLRHEPDALLGSGEIVIDVVAENFDLSARLVHE